MSSFLVKWKRQLLLALAFFIILPISIKFVSAPFASIQAGNFYKANLQKYQAMSKGMDYWVKKKMGRENFVTGSDRFDGEWLFGTYLMTAIGYCQQVLQFPELKNTYLPIIRESLLEIQTESVQKFDVEAWGESPFAFQRSDHTAFLGYYNLALSLYHLIQKSDSKDELILLNAKITKYLIKRYKISPTKLLLSYPTEVYAVDNCATIASIAIYNKAVNQPQHEIIQEWLEVCRKTCLDPKTGTLIQSLHWQNSAMVEYPRASGTFLGIYFLSFVDFEFAQRLYNNAQKEFFQNFLGFGFVREYTREHPSGKGDIDSGPVIFGYGLSPMGFLIGCARIFEDRETFESLFATCYAGGAPILNDGQFNWATGSPVGDGVMFGMLTSLKQSDWKKLE